MLALKWKILQREMFCFLRQFDVLLSCHRTERKTNKKGTSMTSTWGTCSCPSCITHSTVRSTSLVLLSFTMSHQCLREAWLVLGFFISCSTKETCLHALRVPEPHGLMRICDAAECCKHTHSRDLQQKRLSAVEALDRLAWWVQQWRSVPNMLFVTSHAF